MTPVSDEPVKVKPRSDDQFQIVGEAFLSGIGAPNKSRDNDLATAKATLSLAPSQPVTGEEVERLLRASVPEPYKSATSPVGAVQGYIADLEARLSAVEGKAKEALQPLAESTGWRVTARHQRLAREALTTITGGENER